MTRYMVIERFKPGATKAVYERFERDGRLLPEGLFYVDSWPCAEAEICFQTMETDDPSLFDIWTARWADLAAFEIYPLVRRD